MYCLMCFYNWIKFCNCLYNHNTELINQLIKFPSDPFNQPPHSPLKVTGKYLSIFLPFPYSCAFSKCHINQIIQSVAFHFWLLSWIMISLRFMCVWVCSFLLLSNIPYMKVFVAQSCLLFCYTMDCSLPGISVHRILLVRILDWVAIDFSRASSQPRDAT